MKKNEIEIQIKNITLFGNVNVPEDAKAIILFAHGSGSSRFSSRNKMVADSLNKAGIGTLLFDLLTEKEESIDEFTRKYRFNIPLISERLVLVTEWLKSKNEWGHLKIGYFGASTGAAAALNAAADLSREVFAVVSRGGRPDLADDEKLAKINVPCLFIVGGDDEAVIEMNKEAINKMHSIKITELRIIPGATHLFEEPGKLEEVAELAKNFFLNYI